MYFDDKLAVVSIGRNEGERFRRCLHSISTQTKQHVYVDSGSTDDSVRAADSMGVEVVMLDMALPFTAARARNEGFRRALQVFPRVEYVQFIDGDCELFPGWLENAVAFLEQNHEVAIVCGRRRERFPENSIYNMLCDAEWNTPVGESRYCGGDALVRVNAFESVRGFRANLIAGEEPELCVRLRAAGWRVWRLDQDMTSHDAAMMRFGQWWKRSLRAGYAFAEGAHLHGKPPERHWVTESRRAMIWGLAIPLITVGLTAVYGGWAVALLLVYPLQVCRLALSGGGSEYVDWLKALFLVLGKFPEATGHLKYYSALVAGKSIRLIEYK